MRTFKIVRSTIDSTSELELAKAHVAQTHDKTYATPEAGYKKLIVPSNGLKLVYEINAPSNDRSPVESKISGG